MAENLPFVEDSLRIDDNLCSIKFTSSKKLQILSILNKRSTRSLSKNKIPSKSFTAMQLLTIIIESFQRSHNEKHRSNPRQNNANCPKNPLVKWIFFLVDDVFSSMQGTLQHILLKYSHFELNFHQFYLFKFFYFYFHCLKANFKAYCDLIIRKLNIYRRQDKDQLDSCWT